MAQDTEPEGKRSGEKPITTNRKAFHDYTILEKIEAGVELRGTEVKSLRAGRVNFKDSYVDMRNGEMILIGTHINSTIERPSARGTYPQTQCLANGGWNFDWQRTYTYDAAIDELPSIEVGDRISVSCAWNNTMDNPFVERMLHDSNLPPQPIDITLGEQTTNEMCLEIFGIATDAPAQPLLATDPVVLPNLRAIDMFVRE